MKFLHFSHLQSPNRLLSHIRATRDGGPLPKKTTSSAADEALAACDVPIVCHHFYVILACILPLQPHCQWEHVNRMPNDHRHFNFYKFLLFAEFEDRVSDALHVLLLECLTTKEQGKVCLNSAWLCLDMLPYGLGFDPLPSKWSPAFAFFLSFFLFFLLSFFLSLFLSFFFCRFPFLSVPFLGGHEGCAGALNEEKIREVSFCKCGWG